MNRAAAGTWRRHRRADDRSPRGRELVGPIETLPPGDKDRELYADRATIELGRHSVAEVAYLSGCAEHLANGDALDGDKENDTTPGPSS